MNRITSNQRWLFLAILGLLLADVRYVQADEFPHETWRHVPVYHHGRVKPMDAYARQIVQKVTEFNKSKPKLNLKQYFTAEELKQPELAGALEIFPEGEERKFTNDQLLFDWLARPESWERVPFIYLAREDVREELGFPVTGPGGAKLNFVSPHDIETSVGLRKYLMAMGQRRDAARAEERSFEETPMDSMVWSDLLFRYAVYREVTLDPTKPVIGSEPIPLIGARDRMMSQVVEASQLFMGQPNSSERSLSDQLGTLRQIGAQHALGRGSTELLVSFDELRGLAAEAWVDVRSSLENEDPEPLLPDEPPTPEELDPVITKFRAAASDLAKTLEEQRDEVNSSETLSQSEYDNIKPMFQEMLVKVQQLEHIGLEIHQALYSNSTVGGRFASTSMDRAGNTLQVVPSLNPYALSSKRDPSDLSQPWLGFSALLYGSNSLLQPYDQQMVQRVRDSWSQAKSAYLNDKELAEPMQQLASSLQQLGQQTSQQRTSVIESTLEPSDRDDQILAHTAYPPVDDFKIATEVRYSKLDPFMYAWIYTFIATVGFALAFAVLRKPMFWIGVAFLSIAIIWSTYGFYMRVVVTGWAPVTNMYETVIFVPWVVCMLGISFLILPLIEQGRLAAWRATAFPFTWESSPLNESQNQMFSSLIWQAINWISGIARLAMMVAIFIFMTMRPVYDGNRPIISLTDFWEQVSAHGFMYAMIFMVVKMLVLVLTVWFVPRLLIASVYAVFLCPYQWYLDKQLDQKFEKTYQRTYYGLAAAACGTFLFCVASIAPIVDTGSTRVLNAEFSPLQPVLRSNVWLTIHVLTIVASYGAGILAWGLGWLALGYYMFGRYRAPVMANTLKEGLAPAHAQSGPAMTYRPPEECFTLGSQCYRAIQVAVLLLATGTILGGIWADVSWGRFWGWDPKEVWALVTLLIYVAILHARFAGWFNNFGMVVGTVIGFSAIVGSWYGVNFLLPLFKGGDAVGLHSYGSGGKGSEIMVIGFVASNWIALGIVAMRFHLSKLAVVDENDLKEVIVDADVAPRDSTDSQIANPAT